MNKRFQALCIGRLRRRDLILYRAGQLTDAVSGYYCRSLLYSRSSMTRTLAGTQCRRFNNMRCSAGVTRPERVTVLALTWTFTLSAIRSLANSVRNLVSTAFAAGVDADASGFEGVADFSAVIVVGDGAWGERGFTAVGGAASCCGPWGGVCCDADSEFCCFVGDAAAAGAAICAGGTIWLLASGCASGLASDGAEFTAGALEPT